jgi:tryptophanase
LETKHNLIASLQIVDVGHGVMGGDRLGKLKMVYEPKYLRFFQARFELCQ